MTSDVGIHIIIPEIPFIDPTYWGGKPNESRCEPGVAGIEGGPDLLRGEPGLVRGELDEE